MALRQHAWLLLAPALFLAGCGGRDDAAQAPEFGCDATRLSTAGAQAPPSTPGGARTGADGADGTPTGEATASATPTEDAAAGLPPGAIALFDLPFPYDGSELGFGGSVAEFTAAAQRRRAGGRINSFFDHQLPLYGAEVEADRATESILIFDGAASPADAYSGHPGYDFAVADEARRRTTPVLAAAAGTVSEVAWHDLMGWHVMLRHDVPEVGAFQTIYMHLQDDEIYRATRDRLGQRIDAGAHIGTMGTTGNSDGEHLHFEVRFDIDEDGRFRYGAETVDPFGFLPSPDFAASPWYERQNAGPPRYLWNVPLQVAAAVPADGGGDLPAPPGLGGGGGADRRATAAARTEEDGGRMCAPSGSLPPGGTVQLGWSPDPAPSTELAGIGASLVLSVVDADGNPVPRIDPPVAVEMPFDPARLDELEPESVAVHRWEPGAEPEGRRPGGLAQAEDGLAPGGRWRRLPTRIDAARGLAVAATDRPARLALLGRPVRDVVAPTTRIVLDGPRGAAGEGGFYKAVTVTLTADDPSGITQMRYRLSFDAPWRRYDGPFVLRHAGIPQDVPEGVDARFLRGEARRLIIASAVDGAGNIEDPPAQEAVVIDRREDPVYTPPPATQTAEALGSSGESDGDGSSEGDSGGGDPSGADLGDAGSEDGALGAGNEARDASSGAAGAAGSNATSAGTPGQPLARSGGGTPLPEGGPSSPAAAATPTGVDGARTGDRSAASGLAPGLAPGVATAGARSGRGLPTLPVVGPGRAGATPRAPGDITPPPTARIPRADVTATAAIRAATSEARASATARARRGATATAVGARRRSTAMIPDPIEPPGPGRAVPTATPTPPALAAPVLSAPADHAEPRCGEPVVLDWEAVPSLRGRGAHGWQLERLTVGDDGVPRWQPLDAGQTVGGLSLTTLSAPPCARRLRWRVRGIDLAGRPGAWSNWRRLTLKPVPTVPPQEVVAPTQIPGSGYPYP